MAKGYAGSKLILIDKILVHGAFINLQRFSAKENKSKEMQMRVKLSSKPGNKCK